MKKLFLKVSLLLITAMPLLAFATTPANLMCAQKDSGFLPLNTDTGAFIGSGYLYKKGECNRAVDTYRSDLGQGLVCSWNGSGWALYDVISGARVGCEAYWYKLETCERALSLAANNVVCAPRGTGSGVYDITNGFFIGNGYYYNISDCVFAPYFATDSKVCAPENGYTAIFRRRYNDRADNELFFTSEQCGHLIK